MVAESEKVDRPAVIHLLVSTLGVGMDVHRTRIDFFP